MAFKSVPFRGAQRRTPVLTLFASTSQTQRDEAL